MAGQGPRTGSRLSTVCSPAVLARESDESEGGNLDGRTTEIQRLIGRSLRAVVDLAAVGERTITIDCDVLEADGGTRTLSITGGLIALIDALGAIAKELPEPGKLPLRDSVSPRLASESSTVYHCSIYVTRRISPPPSI